MEKCPLKRTVIISTRSWDNLEFAKNKFVIFLFIHQIGYNMNVYISMKHFGGQKWKIN